MNEQQQSALSGLHREYLVNKRCGEGMDRGTAGAIEDVLTAFGLPHICDPHQMEPTEYGDLQCRVCGETAEDEEDAT